MEPWQWLVLVFLVLLPFALLADLHPARERLDAAGRVLDRRWRPHRTHPPPGPGPTGAQH